jgi:predicted solute-binding protein
MTICVIQVAINKVRLTRMTTVKNKDCAKCDSEFKVGDEAMKKRVRSGNHKYYHLKCYEDLYL